MGMSMVQNYLARTMETVVIFTFYGPFCHSSVTRIQLTVNAVYETCLGSVKLLRQFEQLFYMFFILGSITTANGSALVKIGNTSVMCGIKAVSKLICF
jgi:3' exoribonuclease family, domain 1